MHTSRTRFAIFLDELTEPRPGVVTTDHFYCLVLTWMSRKYVIMLVVENMETEVIRVRNVDEVILPKKTIWSDGPSVLLGVLCRRDHRGARIGYRS